MAFNEENRFKAIIWDCDGCLIDSEHIAFIPIARTLAEAGYYTTTEDLMRRFCGVSGHHAFDTLQQETGINYRAVIDIEKMNRERDHLFRIELKPILGIHALLDKIHLPIAIASGSEWNRLELTLKLTGLFDRFGPHIYPASLVKNGKPAPDIFLYAAEKLGVKPEDCLVIEDSENGVKAGKAAGMCTYGFTGGSHILDKEAHAHRLISLGADWIFDSMLQLEQVFAYTSKDLELRF